MISLKFYIRVVYSLQIYDFNLQKLNKVFLL
uniref:Uncharacterized protein n=1 Tax=Siphoviridae sp. cteDy1 TaxID=2825587 RepID=A0A8S5V410_9CAUD|nr:MAG TPA: hypothetical protein [Siphoviridae sp. cteDy1]